MTISLVIPTYNGSKFVEQTLVSVINQVCPFDEIIISDDHSSDDTLAICEKYADKVKIFRNPQGPSGFVNGWNNAISKATGDYICILHQDDLLDLSFLLEVRSIIENNPDVLHFFTTCYYIDERGEDTGVSYHNDAEGVVRYSGLEYVKAYQNLGSPHIHRCPGVITHRSIFDKIKYNPKAGHIADDDFFYRVGQYTDVVGLLKPLASYRQHASSETGKLQDSDLVRRLIRDYSFQLDQWRNNRFLDEEAYHFFRIKLARYRKRCFGYGVRQMSMPQILFAFFYRQFKGLPE